VRGKEILYREWLPPVRGRGLKQRCYYNIIIPPLLFSWWGRGLKRE